MDYEKIFTHLDEAEARADRVLDGMLVDFDGEFTPPEELAFDATLRAHNELTIALEIMAKLKSLAPLTDKSTEG